MNIVLDEFDSMIPINNFDNLIGYARSLKIRFTVTIRSYIHLYNMYQKEKAEVLKLCFGNTMFLLSEDIYTLDEIVKMCGNRIFNGKVEPLVTVEELKILNYFEAIVILPRLMPIKTKLVPDYQIDYNYEFVKCDFPKREIKETNVFTYKKS